MLTGGAVDSIVTTFSFFLYGLCSPLVLDLGLSEDLALAYSGFYFLAIGGLFNVFTTVFFIMRVVTLFLK